MLVHGSGSHSRYRFPLARAIAERDAAHVYTPDLRGHGLNPACRGDVDYIEQLEDDLADLVEVLPHVSHMGIAVHKEASDAVVRWLGSF